MRTRGGEGNTGRGEKRVLEMEGLREGDGGGEIDGRKGREI